ncbi:MAG: hypothetical protein ACI8YQ_002407 [Polaribacter sp.]|jgi:hypothetical protein
MQNGRPSHNTLDTQRIDRTISRLLKRIDERFPDSGLGKVGTDFYEFNKHCAENIEWISRPIYWIRIVTYLFIGLAAIGLIYSITLLRFEVTPTFSNVAAVLEAVVNDVILLGAGIFFLFTLENRVKRTRAIRSLNELRGFAHVVDMHQLTKDPQLIGQPYSKTDNSPKRTMTKFELQRYLDYCSELLSLIGKTAVLYAQQLPDEVVLSSANELEQLCSSLSQKIWQKLIILNGAE